MDFIPTLLIGVAIGWFVSYPWGMRYGVKKGVSLAPESDLIAEVKRRRYEERLNQQLSKQVSEEVDTEVNQELSTSKP